MDAITQSEVQTLYSRQNASVKNVIEANDLVSLKELIQNGIDINEQDNDGDTGLHHAIRSDASIEVLRKLIMTGANTTIENNAGYTPLHCVKPKSIDTMMNLLKLEKSCPLFDEINNNVLCVLVGGRISEYNIDEFWRTILKEFSLSDININLKNDLGETLLHVAASQIGIALEKHLTVILSTFENLSQFEKDLQGRTFLHIVFENTFTDNDGKYSDFITCLMQGRFPQCSTSIVRSLLNCQDNYKSTPLHMALRDPFNMIMPDILQIFVESGADLSLPSSYNLTMMHHVIRNRDTIAIRYITPENEVANIDYLASRGMDVNAVDIFGGSPLYYSLLPDTITHLLSLGAHVGIRNKFGQTALVFHVCLIALRDWDCDPYNGDIFKSLLDNGSNVDALDNYGSSILHYAAWQGLPIDIVQLFLERGAKIYCDANGKFPCDVAFSRRNKDLADSLCNCDSQRHPDDEIALPDNETINDKELKELHWNDIESISNFRRQMMDSNFLSSLLRTQGIGAVSFVGEAANLQSAVNKLIQEVCAGISESNDLFSCSLVQAGSVGENTKIGLPDEFDFVCILDGISEMCRVKEKHSPDGVGYANIILKDEYKEQYIGRYFDRQGHLKTHIVWTQFRTLLGEQLVNPNLFSHPNIFYAGDKIKGSTHPTCQFSLMWMGRYYKCLKIDIDLVPAVHVRGWWPDGAQIQNLACDAEMCKNEGFMLLVQTTMNNEDQPSSKARISAQRAEKLHMSQLPQIARDAYMISKVLCDSRICPDVDAGRIAAVDTFITSYMLKNCTFYVYQANENFQTKVVEETYTADELHEFVIEICCRLRDACTEETLVSYILPWQNIFSSPEPKAQRPRYQVSVYRTIGPLVEFAITLKIEDEEDAHSRCAYRSVFAKIILTMLGQTQKLSESEEEVLFEYESWLLSECSANEDSD